jgi:hypothetical protein
MGKEAGWAQEPVWTQMGAVLSPDKVVVAHRVTITKTTRSIIMSVYSEKHARVLVMLKQSLHCSALQKDSLYNDL